MMLLSCLVVTLTALERFLTSMHHGMSFQTTFVLGRKPAIEVYDQGLFRGLLRNSSYIFLIEWVIM